MKILAV